MTVIPIVIGTLDIVTKGLVLWLEELEIRGRVETILTTELLRLKLNKTKQKRGTNFCGIRITRSYKNHHSGCKLRQMNPKFGQRLASPGWAEELHSSKARVK